MRLRTCCLLSRNGAHLCLLVLCLLRAVEGWFPWVSYLEEYANGVLPNQYALARSALLVSLLFSSPSPLPPVASFEAIPTDLRAMRLKPLPMFAEQPSDWIPFLIPLFRSERYELPWVTCRRCSSEIRKRIEVNHPPLRRALLCSIALLPAMLVGFCESDVRCWPWC